MIKKGLKFPVAFITLFLIFFFSVSVWAQADSGKPLHKVTLQLRWFHQFQFAGFYAAKEKHLYQKEGLDVEIKQGGFNLQTVDEVMANRAQFGVTNSEILLSRLKDKKPVVLVAPLFQHSSLVFVARKETQITHPQDFIGKRVKMTKLTRDLELHAMLLSEGVTLNQFKRIDGPVKRPDLFDKDIDVLSAYVTNAPYYYIEKQMAFNIIRPAAYGVDFYGDSIFTSAQYAAKHPDRVAAFKKASIEGWKYALANKKEIIDLILKTYAQDKVRAHLEYEADTIDKLMLPDLIDIGHSNPGRWRSIADVFVQHGVLPKDYSLEGFIFNPDPETDFFWVWVTLVVLIVVSILFSIVSIMQYGFNRRLNREIRKKEKSEQALAQSEARLTAMFENIHSGVVIYSALDQGKDFIIKSFNKAAQQIENLTHQDVIGRKVTDVFPGIKRFGLFEVFQRVYHSGTPEHMPTTLYHDKQIVGWRENYVYKLPSGEIAAVYNDETIRKKAELNRKHMDTVNRIIINSRHTQKMLQDLLDALLDIFESDRAWLVYPCDPSTECFTVSVESTRPEWPGLGASDRKIALTPEMAQAMKAVLNADTPIVYGTKTKVGIPDWMVIDYHIKSAIRMALYPKIDKPWMLGMHRCESTDAWTGEDQSLFDAIGRRISDGLNAILLIQELEKTNKTLMESEDRFVKIFHSSPVGLIIATQDELLVSSINKSFLNITGYSEKNILGKSLLEKEVLIAPESSAAMEKLKRQDSLSHIGILFYNLDNELREGRLSSQWVHIDGKQSVIISFEDITDHQKVEKEKQAAQKHAAEQEKYALIGQVAGKMAHDFNNILGAIMGNAELSLLDCKETATAKTLSLILDQTRKGRDLTKNLVAFAKDQEPRQDFFNINEKIHLVLNLLKKDLKGIKVNTAFAEAMPDLLADPGMIENALVNILHNAIHAMSKQGNPVLTLSTFSDDETVLITIEDNGCGIPEEHQKSIYAPAFTLKSGKDILDAYDKSIRGTGYGLFNAKKIVQKHRGRIWFETQTSKGTKFFICLPVIKKDLTVKEKTEVEKSTLHKARDILIVEDEQSIADVQALMLTSDPFLHRVDVAHNGHMAQEFLQNNIYDLITLDYRLPGGVNGMDLYRMIRKKNPKIPILFISGNIEFLESVVTLTRQDRHLDHLTKPCQNKEYVDCINRLLEGSGLQGFPHEKEETTAEARQGS